MLDNLIENCNRLPADTLLLEDEGLTVGVITRIDGDDNAIILTRQSVENVVRWLTEWLLGDLGEADARDSTEEWGDEAEECGDDGTFTLNVHVESGGRLDTFTFHRVAQYEWDSAFLAVEREDGLFHTFDSNRVVGVEVVK